MKLKGKWPEHLIVPSESQFQHEGRWVMVVNDNGTSDDYYDAAELGRVARRGLMNDKDREDVKFHCGTSCC